MRKKTLIICIFILAAMLLCALIYKILKKNIALVSESIGNAWNIIENDQEKNAIEKAVEETGNYYDWDYSYDKENDILKIVLYPEMVNSDYKKIADVFESHIIQDDQYKKYGKIEILFADHNSKMALFAVKNFEDDGKNHEHFDVVKVGMKMEGYNFDISIPEGKYIRGFKRLEIGKSDLEETKWIIFHFRDLETISCNLDEKDYEELCDFFSDIMPECRIINLPSNYTGIKE